MPSAMYNDIHRVKYYLLPLFDYCLFIIMSSSMIWDSTGSDINSAFAPEVCNQLDAIFKPNNVALIGASEREGSVSTVSYTHLTLPTT